MTHPLFAVHAADTDAFRVQILWAVAGRDGTLALEAGTAGLDSPEIVWEPVASLRDAEDRVLAALPTRDLDAAETLPLRIARQARDVAARTRRGVGNTVLVSDAGLAALQPWDGQSLYGLRLAAGPVLPGSRFAPAGGLGQGAVTLWLDTAATPDQPLHVGYIGNAAYDRPLLYVDRGDHGLLGRLRAAGRSVADWTEFFGGIRIAAGGA